MSKKLTLLERFSNSKIMQKFEEDECHEVLRQRTEASREIESLQAKSGDILSKSQAAFKEKQTEFVKIQNLLKTVTSACNQARLDLMNQSARFDQLIERQKEILLDSYDPAIDEAIDFFNKKFDWLRRSGSIHATPSTMTRNMLTDRKTLTGFTNKSAVLSSLSYCRAAITALEKSKLFPALDSKWLDDLKAKMPDSEEYSAVSSEHDAERVQAFIPRMSDDHVDYLTGKLLERADTLIHGAKVAKFNAARRAER